MIQFKINAAQDTLVSLSNLIGQRTKLAPEEQDEVQRLHDELLALSDQIVDIFDKVDDKVDEAEQFIGDIMDAHNVVSR